MMGLDPVALTVAADLFANLAAGWFGAALVVPVVSNRPVRINAAMLVLNLLLGIVSLVISFGLRKAAGLM